MRATAKRERLAQWLHGDGIELGALHQPLPVPADAHVRYVDRFNVNDLRAHYPELSNLDLVPVSYIGSAEQLTGIEDSSLDFVIACHVIEHLEDPTQGLREIHRVLREGGILYCALPESRVTFDSQRPLTTVEHLLDDHEAGRTTRREHFVEYVKHVEVHQPWWPTDSLDPETRVKLLMDMDYSIHYHAWRADTFLEYVFAVRRTHGLIFEPLSFAPCEPDADNEFIILLRKGIAAVPPIPPRDPAPHPRASEARRLAGRVRDEWRAGGVRWVAKQVVRRAHRAKIEVRRKPPGA